MEKPKCRFCDDRHWGLCATTTIATAKERVAEIEKAPVSRPASTAKFDRAAYQREYMRAYRAKRRGK